MTDEAFEAVRTMTHYIDGPIEGVADYRGRPHLYKRRFDDSADDYCDIFDLRPLDDDTFDLVMRKWAIWEAWKVEFDAGQHALESHPYHISQNPEYDALTDAIALRLTQAANQVIVVMGEMRRIRNRVEKPNRGPSDFEVRWTDI